MGIAVDAASRHYDVLLLERSDFGKGTSSRSTKLLHGGVRYLQQGNLPLVFEALRERGLLLRNAPTQVEKMPFVVPAYHRWEAPYFGIGLKLYSLLAGRHNTFGPSPFLSRKQALAHVPNLRRHGLCAGVLYYDGQFDDARLLISLARTAADHGATLLNYAEVTGLTRQGSGAVKGVTARDGETNVTFHAEGKAIINATGPFCDAVRTLDDSHAKPMVMPSQGIHLVVEGSFLAGKSAMVVPRTSDGRVMFAIPWLGHTLLGTTDTPIPALAEEPAALESEISFVLETAAKYLERAPARRDVLSVFAGIRPLLRVEESKSTAALSRDHTLHTDPSGLITITGGKWTTYRRMAEICVDRAVEAGGQVKRPCVTSTLPLHPPDSAEILALAQAEPRLAARLHPSLAYTAADVIWGVRMEMARTIEDVLARRTRTLFLRAKAAIEIAPDVATLMAPELGWSASRTESELVRFRSVANAYILDR